MRCSRCHHRFNWNRAPHFRGPPGSWRHRLARAESQLRRGLAAVPGLLMTAAMCWLIREGFRLDGWGPYLRDACRLAAWGAHLAACTAALATGTCAVIEGARPTLGLWLPAARQRTAWGFEPLGRDLIYLLAALGLALLHGAALAMGCGAFEGHGAWRHGAWGVGRGGMGAAAPAAVVAAVAIGAAVAEPRQRAKARQPRHKLFKRTRPTRALKLLMAAFTVAAYAYAAQHTPLAMVGVASTAVAARLTARLLEAAFDAAVHAARSGQPREAIPTRSRPWYGSGPTLYPHCEEFELTFRPRYQTWLLGWVAT